MSGRGRIPAPTRGEARRALEAPCRFRKDARVAPLLRRWMVMPEAAREVLAIARGGGADAATINARCDVCRLCPHRVRRPLRAGQDPSDVCTRHGGDLVVARASVRARGCDLWPATGPESLE